MIGKTEESGTIQGEVAKVSPPPIVENLHAPEVYADFATFFSMRGKYNISLTLSSVRCDSSSRVNSGVVIARLVMPAVNAVDLVNDLHKFLIDNGFMSGESGAN